MWSRSLFFLYDERDIFIYAYRAVNFFHNREALTRDSKFTVYVLSGEAICRKLLFSLRCLRFFFCLTVNKNLDKLFVKNELSKDRKIFHLLFTTCLTWHEIWFTQAMCCNERHRKDKRKDFQEKKESFNRIRSHFFHVIKRSPIKLISFPPFSSPPSSHMCKAVPSYFNVASVCAKLVEATMGEKTIKMLMTLAINIW